MLRRHFAGLALRRRSSKAEVERLKEKVNLILQIDGWLVSDLVTHIFGFTPRGLRRKLKCSSIHS